MTSQRALIVGASHAGAQLAASLRQEGWTGEIVPHRRGVGAALSTPAAVEGLPGGGRARSTNSRSAAPNSWHRAGDPTPECEGGGDRPLGWSSRVEHRRRAALRQARAVHWGPPSTAFHPGADLVGVYYRTAADVEMIREATSPGCRAVIIGGGYIGLETAAPLRALGLEVTVLEATGRVLERVTAPLYRRSSTGSTGRRA